MKTNNLDQKCQEMVREKLEELRRLSFDKLSAATDFESNDFEIENVQLSMLTSISTLPSDKLIKVIVEIFSKNDLVSTLLASDGFTVNHKGVYHSLFESDFW